MGASKNVGTGEVGGVFYGAYKGQVLDIAADVGNPNGYATVLSIPPDATASDPRYSLLGNLRSAIKGTQDNAFWITHPSRIVLSANAGAGNQFNVYGDRVEVLGDFTVYNGSKNAAQITRDGIRATPAYETAENYVGDIGENKTGQDNTVTIEIDPFMYDLGNTEMGYQVFVTSYSEAHVWVSQRDDMSFVVESDTPNAPFGWELKAHRRGYESQRLVDTGKTYEDLEKMEGMIPNGD